MAWAVLLMLAIGSVAVGCGEMPEVALPATSSDRPTGTLVYVRGPNRLVAVDVATGRRRVRRVTAVAGCGPQMYVTGGRLVFAGYRQGRTIVFSAPLSLEEPPTRLGSAHAFVRSAKEGRVWLAGTSCDRPQMTGVREVTVDGEVTVDSDRRVPGSWVTGAVDDGLVIQRGRDLVVWDPVTGRTTRALDLDAAGESRGNLVSGCMASTECRDLVIVDTATGRTLTARTSRGYRIVPSATFSPDGSLVATTAALGRRWRVALVDPRDGSHALVPGPWTQEHPDLGWSASGWLFIRAAGSRRVLAYRPGAERTIPLPVRIPKHIVFVAG